MGIELGTAALIGGGLSAAGSLASGVLGSKASSKAADAQAASRTQSNQDLYEMLQRDYNVQEEMLKRSQDAQSTALGAGQDTQSNIFYNLNLPAYKNLLAQEQPYTQAGTVGLQQYLNALQNPASAYANDPYYGFLQSEGTKALERGASARGGLLGGAQQKALQNFGQSTAQGYYGNRLQQYLASIGVGQNALNQMGATTNAMANTGKGYADARSGLYGNWANNTSQLNTGYANAIQNANTALGSQISGNAVGAGDARASGYINQANALSGGLSSAGNNLMTAYYMNQLNPSTYPAAPGSASYWGGGP